jgi:kynurenine formamidase
MSNALEVYKGLKDLKCYDISQHFQSNMPMFGGNPNLWIVPDARTYDKHTYYCQVLVMGEHAGPHIDAPAHIIKGAKYIDEYAGDYFIAPYKKYAIDTYDPQAGEYFGMDKIKELEERDGFSLDEGDIVLLQYGWHKYYLPEENDEAKRSWYDQNSAGITNEVMQYFVDSKVKAVGADNSNCGVPKKDNKFLEVPPPDHAKYFLPNGILIMENFGDMTAAPAEGIFVAIPLPIDKGSGCPVRPLLFA